VQQKHTGGGLHAGIGKGRQSFDSRLEKPTAHGIGRAMEKDFHLQVVESGGMVAEVAVGLMVEVLKVVVRKGSRFHILR
jgi:hypothetical protein